MKMTIFKIYLLLLLFASYLFAREDFTPLEQCTYKNEKFWIKILNLCSEGNITCDKVVYVGVNKNNGDYIILNGKSISDRNMNFKGYVFKMVFMNTIFLKIIFYIFLKIIKSCKNISWNYVKINNKIEKSQKNIL